MTNDDVIIDTFALRVRYGEVDQMGYVYHANYVSYCHQARTELMRKMGICDNDLETRGIMMPVIAFDISYKQPGHYDDELFITTTIKSLPTVRFHFEYKVHNAENKLLCEAKSSVVFVKKDTRQPIKVPDFVLLALKQYKSINSNQ